MNDTTHRVIQIFFVAIVLYLVLKNKDGAVAVLKQLGDTTTEATKQLQGA